MLQFYALFLRIQGPAKFTRNMTLHDFIYFRCLHSQVDWLQFQTSSPFLSEIFANKYDQEVDFGRCSGPALQWRKNSSRILSHHLPNHMQVWPALSGYTSWWEGPPLKCLLDHKPALPSTLNASMILLADSPMHRPPVTERTRFSKKMPIWDWCSS